MATIFQKFGNKVRELRKKEGLSQEELASRIRCDVRTLVAIEGGKRNPTLNTIYKISTALKISLDSLLKL